MKLGVCERSDVYEMKKIKKIFKKSVIVLPILLLLTAYRSIPENITVMQGQSVDFEWGTLDAAEVPGDRAYQAKLFKIIPVKKVNVSVVPRRYVIPSGEAIGVKIYSDGVLVVGISDVTAKNGQILAPAKDAGIKTGDRIVDVNGEKIQDTNAFVKKINDSKGIAKLVIIRDDYVKTVKLSATESSDGYKVGLWVRDSTAGIGTLTFYDPENFTFGALGHGICDSDTKELMTVRKGSVNACNIRGVIKGEKGTTGELLGDFGGKKIGEIQTNSLCGIQGMAEAIPQRKLVPVASRFEVKTGKATILCDIDGNGPKVYEIEITKVTKSATDTGKNLVLRVTDPDLIEKTGGIVQGMSGSPIIQNGKIVGAVTHVFVNDPTRGYGIFIENMLAEAEKIK